MILLSDFLDELCVGEGSQIASVVTKSSGKLNPEKVNGIISILNAALKDIFKRFVVQKTEVILNTKIGQLDYKLDNSAIFHPVDNPTGYLVSATPFSVIAVTGIRTLKEGIQMPLNQQNKLIHSQGQYQYEHNSGYVPACYNTHSFHTVSYDTLRIPHNLDSSSLVVSLRAGHKKIAQIPAEQVESFDYDSVVIDLPETYNTALIYYTISRLLNSKGAETIGRGIFHEGDNYYDKYVRECETLKVSDSEEAEIPDMNLGLSRFGFI